MSTRVFPSYYSPSGFQTLSVGATAVGFTLPSSPTCRAVLLTLETAQIRMRLDGTDPTAAVGHLVQINDAFEITNIDAINQAMFIAVSATASLTITYFGGSE